ncbi:MAG: NADH-quinone oxidoreductase subunit NuoE family protein [Candidatus Nanopelagicales bacterium]
MSAAPAADWTAERAARALARSEEPGSILVALQEIQAEFGYVPDQAIAAVAEALNVSRADAYGVLTFYSDLRTDPPPPMSVRICMGEACQAVGARDLLAAVRDLDSARCEVAHVYCLGNCALGPSAVIDGRLLGRASAEAVHRLAGVPS